MGTLSIKHVAITDRQLKELFGINGKNGWEEFYKIYPKSPGIITLSRPGFSNNGTLAVIYMGIQSNGLAGYGQIYVLEEKEGKWVELKTQIGPSWIS